MVLLDACVLVPVTLCDVLLELGDAGWFTPLWSEEILDELERTLTRDIGLEPAASRRRRVAMRQAYPRACVEGMDELTPRLRNHPADRHVLAAAILGEADLLVTANIRDFHDVRPAEDLIVETPDQFLLALTDGRLDAVCGVIAQMVTRYTRPRRTSGDIVARLRTLTPAFAAAVAAWAGSDAARGDLPSNP